MYINYRLMLYCITYQKIFRMHEHYSRVAAYSRLYCSLYGCTRMSASDHIRRVTDHTLLYRFIYKYETTNLAMSRMAPLSFVDRYMDRV